MSERFLSPGQVAKLLGKTRTTVTRWCRIGYLKAVKIGGGWYILKDEFYEKMRDILSDDG